MVRRLLFFLLCSVCGPLPCAGEAHARTGEENASLVDRFYDTLSETVVDLSDSLDSTLAGVLGASGKEAEMRRERERSDAFFQTRRFLNETARTYIRLRTGVSLRSLDDTDARFNVRAHLPLHRVRRRLRLFVEDVTGENDENLLKRVDAVEENPESRPVDASVKFGLNYFAPRAFGIDSKYSLGLSGMHPYVRARYSYFRRAGEWMVEPVQTLQYSEKYDFSEQTTLYLDRELGPNTLFRVRFDRGTRAHEKGTYYGAGVGCYRTLSRRTGMRLVQTFRGDTGYEYTPEGENDTRRFKGIHTYTTAFGYRRGFWRPWLFVEIVPAVSFRRVYDYDPDYSLTVLVDLFIGNY